MTAVEYDSAALRERLVATVRRSDLIEIQANVDRMRDGLLEALHAIDRVLTPEVGPAQTRAWNGS